MLDGNHVLVQQDAIPTLKGSDWTVIAFLASQGSALAQGKSCLRSKLPWSQGYLIPHYARPF